MLTLMSPICATACLTGAIVASPPIVSTFDAGVEGWVIKDLSCSNFAIVQGTYTLDWLPSAGDPGAHVGRVDPTSNCYFFDAPPAYLGDRSAFLGRGLRFSLRTTVNDWPPGSVLAMIGTNGTILVHDFAQPNQSWKRYDVPLLATSFTVGSAAGPQASAGQVANVLASLAALRISAEYGSELGEETTFLDSVVFGAPTCVGDLNGDGVVDGADLGILLAAWGSGDPLADLNGDRLVDGADLGTLLAAWGPCA